MVSSPVLGLATTGGDYAVRALAVVAAEAAIVDGGGTYWCVSKIVGGAEEPMHLSAGPGHSVAASSGDEKPLCLCCSLVVSEALGRCSTADRTGGGLDVQSRSDPPQLRCHQQRWPGRPPGTWPDTIHGHLC